MMNEQEFLKRFGEIGEQVTGQSLPDDLGLDTELAALGMDSLAQLEMLSLLEEETGRRLPDSALRGLRSVGDIRSLVAVPALAEEE